MTNHEAASEKLLELAFGELPPREARAVEAHAAACDACRGELARIRETRALMARLPVEPPPERGMAVVLAAAREAAAARARKKSILPPWLWAGSVGAIAVAAVAVVSWQLARTAPGGALRERATDLMGSPPPAVTAAPEGAPGRGPPSGIAPSPPPGERVGVRGPAATARPAEAPPTPTVAKAPLALAAPEASRREEAMEWKATPEGAGVGAAGGRGGAVAGGGVKWDRAEPPPPPPRAAESPRAPASSMPAVADAERESAAPVRAPAPSPAPMAAQKARAALAPARKSAAADAAAPEAESVSGPGSVESRSFPDCPGERRRIVERDGDGRVIRYVRVGDRRTVEQRYGADGRLRSAFAIEDGLRRDLPAGAPGLVGDAREAGIDAPPRCSAP